MMDGISVPAYLIVFLAVLFSLFVFAVGLGVIAHACGAEDPRDLKREHCRIVIGPGRSAPLSQLFPSPKQDGEAKVQPQPVTSEAA